MDGWLRLAVDILRSGKGYPAKTRQRMHRPTILMWTHSQHGLLMCVHTRCMRLALSFSSFGTYI
jgi:hypothetical protein